jgi:ArsR family transcriptional regulator
MCTKMHMIETPSRLDQGGALGDACEVVVLHPARVAAARAALAGAPPAAAVAALFALLGDPTRARLLTALTGGELCVCDLAAATGVNRTTVSHQLRVLREGRLVRRRREGKVVYYALADEHVAAVLAMGVAHAAETAPDEEVEIGAAASG